jgi:hypothetical protein
MSSSPEGEQKELTVQQQQRMSIVEQTRGALIALLESGGYKRQDYGSILRYLGLPNTNTDELNLADAMAYCVWAIAQVEEKRGSNAFADFVLLLHERRLHEMTYWTWLHAANGVALPDQQPEGRDGEKKWHAGDDVWENFVNQMANVSESEALMRVVENRLHLSDRPSALSDCREQRKHFRALFSATHGVDLESSLLNHVLAKSATRYADCIDPEEMVRTDEAHYELLKRVLITRSPLFQEASPTTTTGKDAVYPGLRVPLGGDRVAQALERQFADDGDGQAAPAASVRESCIGRLLLPDDEDVGTLRAESVPSFVPVPVEFEYGNADPFEHAKQLAGAFGRIRALTAGVNTASAHVDQALDILRASGPASGGDADGALLDYIASIRRVIGASESARRAWASGFAEECESMLVRQLKHMGEFGKLRSGLDSRFGYRVFDDDDDDAASSPSTAAASDMGGLAAFFRSIRELFRQILGYFKNFFNAAAAERDKVGEVKQIIGELDKLVEHLHLSLKQQRDLARRGVGPRRRRRNTAHLLGKMVEQEIVANMNRIAEAMTKIAGAAEDQKHHAIHNVAYSGMFTELTVGGSVEVAQLALEKMHEDALRELHEALQRLGIDADSAGSLGPQQPQPQQHRGVTAFRRTMQEISLQWRPRQRQHMPDAAALRAYKRFEDQQATNVCIPLLAVVNAMAQLPAKTTDENTS